MVPGGEPTDDDIERHLRGVPAEVWDAIWDAAAEVGAESVHVRWEGGVERSAGGTEPTVSSLPYPVYSAATDRLRSALGALVVPFSWPEWEGVRRYRGGAQMQQAPVADAVRMVTAVLRSERFTDGSIAGAIEDGTLSAALERLRLWHSNERPPPKGRFRP